MFRYICDIYTGWLAQGTGRGQVVTTPELVDTDEDVETVRRSCVNILPPTFPLLPAGGVRGVGHGGAGAGRAAAGGRGQHRQQAGARHRDQVLSW